MLYTKSFVKAADPSDGMRISVMSRHTLSDGVTPSRIITPERYDRWCRIVAPPDKIVGDYYKQQMSWKTYSYLYIEHLRKNTVAEYVRQIASNAMVRDVTLLCIEECADKCHRRLLAEECKLYEPALNVIHR